MLGDATLVNAALLERAYQFDASDFWGREVPAKLRLRAGLLLRDYFPLLVALAAIIVSMVRRGTATTSFWLVQMGYVGVLLGFAGLLKLPPRIALPILDFWLITTLLFWSKTRHNSLLGPSAFEEEKLTVNLRSILGESSTIRWAGVGIVTVVILLYSAKNMHRYHTLQQERKKHEAAWKQIGAQLGNSANKSVLVMAGTSDLLKSLSPYKTYSPGPCAVLLLSGWQSHDPSQIRRYQELSGAPNQTECLRRLARQPSRTKWLLSAETARWLNRRFRVSSTDSVVPILQVSAPLTADTTLQFYHLK
jgi:hypothetical protein